MRAHILDTARELLPHQGPPDGSSPDAALDEIAACAGITRRQLQTYFTSVNAIHADLKAPIPSPLSRPTASARTS